MLHIHDDYIIQITDMIIIRNKILECSNNCPLTHSLGRFAMGTKFHALCCGEKLEFHRCVIPLQSWCLLLTLIDLRCTWWTGFLSPLLKNIWGSFANYSKSKMMAIPVNLTTLQISVSTVTLHSWSASQFMNATPSWAPYFHVCHTFTSATPLQVPHLCECHTFASATP